MEKINKTKKQLLEEIAQLKQQLTAVHDEKNRDSSPGLSAGEYHNLFSQKPALEKKLLDQEVPYQSLFERTNDAVFFLDMDGTILNVNQQGADMLGYKREELIGQHNNLIILPEEQTQSEEVIKKLLAGENLPVYPRRSRKKDGTEITVELNVAIIQALDGEPLFTQTIARDISQRVQAEEALRESEIYFRTLFEYAGDAIFIEDENDRIVDANLQACRLLGYTREELLQLTVADLQSPEFRGELGRIIRQEVDDYGDKPFEKVDQHKDGTRIPVEVTTVKLKNGYRGHVMSIVRDISERKIAEMERQALEDKFTKAFHTSPDSININRLADGMYIDINQGFYDLTGYSAEDVIGKTSLDIDIWVDPNDRARLVKGLREKGKVTNLEAQFRFKDGTIRNGLMSATTIEVNGELCILSITRDITEWTKAQKEIREHQQRFETIFSSLNDAIMVHPLVDDGFASFIEVNDMACKRYGYSRDEFLHLSVMDIINPTKAVKQFSINIRERLLKERQVTYEMVHINKKGDTFPVEINSNLVEQFGKMVILSVVRDISDRKRAEEEIKRNTEELERLYRASSVLLPTAVPDLTILAQSIVDSVHSEFEHANCSLILIEPGQIYLKRVAAVGEYVQAVKQGDLTLHGAGLVPKAITEKRIINEPDVLNNPAYKPNWPDARSEMVIPLVIENHVIGVLDVQSNNPNAFSKDDERIMALFAERAAMAVQNARLFGDAKRRLERLTSLRQIDQAITGNMDLSLTLNIVVNQIMEQLAVDAVSILLYKSELQQLRYITGDGFRTDALKTTKLRLGEGYAGKAALERRLIHVTNLENTGSKFKDLNPLLEEGFIEYYGIPLISKGKVIGVLEIFNRSSLPTDGEWLGFLDTLAGQAAIAIDNIEMFSKLQQTNVELVHAYDTTIEGWAKALELRDMETKDHSNRVLELTLIMAEEFGFNEQDLMHIRRGALLHDIGKIGVPDEILQKPGPLTDEEWEIMKLHPTAAFQLLSPIQYLQPAMDIPYCHHERWDGSGYPRGLKGVVIPLAARIFAVVDVWDALSSDRPYRKAWPQEKILNYIKDESGKQFDPEVVALFLKIIERDLPYRKMVTFAGKGIRED
jgi:PAS domain S-box-containing protein